MTVVAAAYDSPASYALAADDHSIVNGLRIPRQKAVPIGAVFLGGAGSMVEIATGVEWLRAVGSLQAQADLAACLAAMYRHILGTTTRAKDCAFPDSHFVAVGPGGVFVLGSDGGVAKAPDRWAIGCGEHMAIGAMYRRKGSPAQVVRLAVEAACAMADGCFGAAQVLSSATPLRAAPPSAAPAAHR